MALVKCEICAADISDQAEYCPKCGAIRAGPPCPKCGYENAPGDSSCESCGASLKEPEKPPDEPLEGEVVEDSGPPARTPPRVAGRKSKTGRRGAVRMGGRGPGRLRQGLGTGTRSGVPRRGERRSSAGARGLRAGKTGVAARQRGGTRRGRGGGRERGGRERDTDRRGYGGRGGKKKKSNQTPLIIGIIAGAVVLIILVIVIASSGGDKTPAQDQKPRQPGTGQGPYNTPPGPNPMGNPTPSPYPSGQPELKPLPPPPNPGGPHIPSGGGR
jgi:hypothetical protein